MHHMELDFTIYLISEDIEKKYMFLKFYLKDLNKKQTINVSIFDKTLVANRIFVDGRFRISHGTLKITNGYITINLPCIEELRVIMQSIGEFIDKTSVTFPGETDTVNKALLATLQDCDSIKEVCVSNGNLTKKVGYTSRTIVYCLSSFKILRFHQYNGLKNVYR